MAGPIKPSEAESGNHIPEAVFEAFNELIRENVVEGEAIVRKKQVVERILAKIPDISREEVFAKGYLNVERAYEKAGWKVAYDKPGYNESYEAFFRFTKKRKWEF